MNKDKRASVRINGEILEEIKERGLSVQKIVDQFITENIDVTAHIVLNSFRCPCCERTVPTKGNRHMRFWSSAKEIKYHVCSQCKDEMNLLGFDYVGNYNDYCGKYK